MARPIEPTPPLTGEDAERLLADLMHTCSVEEAQRRIDMAKQKLAIMMTPKGRQRDSEKNSSS